MLVRALMLNTKIADLQRELTKSQSELRTLQSSCSHDWTRSEYTPIVTEGYFDPGDPVGTMGIDRRLPHHVPRIEKPKWTRTCSRCGKVEVTEITREHVTKTPQFS